MKMTIQNLAAAAGLAFAAMLFPAPANAGCGSYSFGQPISLRPAVWTPQEQPAMERVGDSSSNGREPIVGMWKFQFKATDGSGFADFGYQQWHSDGTEMANSGGRAPATQNYCLGVWEKTGDRTYKLNHFGFNYDQITGDLTAEAHIGEEVKVSRDGQKLSGTFTIDLYDPTGTTVVQHVQGNVTGTRVTVNTPTP